MTEPRTMAEETLAMLKAEFTRAASKARNRRYSEPMRAANRKRADRIAHAAACVRFVAAIDSGEVRVDTGHYNNGDVWVSTKDGDFRAPTALEAFAKAARDAP